MSRKRNLCLFLILLSALVISGCAIRTYKVTKERVDQEISGNRGYLAGQAKQTEGKARPTTRETYVVEVELGSAIVTTKPRAEKQVTEKKSAYTESGLVEENLLEETESKESAETYKTYQVEKDDTLQKISKKFYGTYGKWKKIYEANKDKINDPNRIKPGLVINIPE